MEHLIFSLNATMPIFFLMVLGACFKKAGIMEGVFADTVSYTHLAYCIVESDERLPLEITDWINSNPHVYHTMLVQV